MASVKDFCEKAELKQLTNLEETAEITDGYICDLLSWVMARGTEGMAWITVQTHLNVLAVALSLIHISSPSPFSPSMAAACSSH